MKKIIAALLMAGFTAIYPATKTVIHAVFDANDSLLQESSSMTIDSGGILLFRKDSNHADGSFIAWEYAYQDSLLMGVYAYPDGVEDSSMFRTYEYDEQGRLVMAYLYNENGEIDYWNSTGYVYWNNTPRVLVFDSTGEVVSRIWNIPDDCDNMVSRVSKGSDSIQDTTNYRSIVYGDNCEEILEQVFYSLEEPGRIVRREIYDSGRVELKIFYSAEDTSAAKIIEDFSYPYAEEERVVTLQVSANGDTLDTRVSHREFTLSGLPARFKSRLQDSTLVSDLIWVYDENDSLLSHRAFGFDSVEVMHERKEYERDGAGRRTKMIEYGALGDTVNVHVFQYID